MDRSNHYEAAFEAYLQWHRLCYIAVNESRRSLHGDVKLKSLDFIVHGETGWRLLVDIKGRRFPDASGRRVWQCWCERDDVDGLLHWETLFGDGYRGLLVFTYHLAADIELPPDTLDLWTWRGRRYLFRVVPADEYREHQKQRSPRWQTVDLPMADFRRLARPLQDFLHVPELVEDETPF